MSSKKAKSIVDVLFTKPKKDKGVNAPRFASYPPNQIQQADLLFLPDDGGYKYALVVVDIGSRLTDAIPLKSKDSSKIVDGFKKIYQRKILNMPKKIEFDSGSEFKGDVAKFFVDNDVKIRVAKPARHRQQAMVERRNQMIGVHLFKRMSAQELLTNHPSTQWTEDLKDIITTLNNREKKKKSTQKLIGYDCAGDACDVLPQGTKVRVALDAPIDVVNGKRLHGRFRDTDIKWEIKPKTITHTIIQANQPTMYLVDNDHGQAYTKSQLLPVQANEQNASSSDIRPIKGKNNKRLYIIDKIINKNTIKGLVHYEVKWKGFKDTTWEPRKILIKDSPESIKEYELTKK